MVESEDGGGWWRVRMAESCGELGWWQVVESEDGGRWWRVRMVEDGGV